MPEIVRRYGVTFRTPISIFTGLGIAGLVDRTVVRDADDCPYVPGSSVKGRLRYFAERVLRSPGGPSHLCVHAPDQPACKDVDTACTLCRLFGAPPFRGLLRVDNANIAPPWDQRLRALREADPNPVVRPDIEIRPGIAISRSRRTVVPDHLFFDEAVPAIEFSGRLALDGSVKPNEIQFLVAVGRLVDALGARKAAGRGALQGGIRIEDGRS